MTIDEAREAIAVGAMVEYMTGTCRPSEYGIVTGVNETYVFVRYGRDQGSKATLPESLRLVINHD